MARKTKQESEKTRQGILEAAFDVFTQKGFTRTTLSDVALAAGVTRGAIYWHFKDKVDLFMALSDAIDDEAGVRPEDIRQERVQSLDDVREEILKYLAHFEARDRYAVFYDLVTHHTEYTGELQPVLDRQVSDYHRILQEIEKALDRLKSTGLVRSDLDPSRSAVTLVALIIGVIAIWLFDPGAFTQTGIVPGILDDFLEGLKP